MFTVALIGADGAGKTTVGRALERSLPFPARYLYMGVNWEASDRLLPTTRLARRLRRQLGGAAPRGGPPDPAAASSDSKSISRRVPVAIWRALSLTNRFAEEWYRQLLAWWYVRRGVVVIFDRHFFSDYHAHDVIAARRSLGRRLHGFVLARFYPRPDLVVFLDAPPEVLFERKGEGTVELLRSRREEYLALADSTPAFVTVDAAQGPDVVLGRVSAILEDFRAERR